MKKPLSSKFYIYVSLASDLIIAGSKFIAAAFTGSASMTSEGIHSVIDAISQLLLLWGIKTSTKLPDEDRPFGYGKEFYFWSFVVSLITFILGGCLSFYEGLQAWKRPSLEGDPKWNYAVLVIACVFVLISLQAALRVFNKRRGQMRFWPAIAGTKDPSSAISILGDLGDLLGIAIAAVGIFLSHYFQEPRIDAIASMLIGAVLVLISGFLVTENKSLLMGEPTRRKTLRGIKLITEADRAVEKVRKQFSMYMGPDEVLLHMNVIFKGDLTTRQITDAIARITRLIRQTYPFIKQIFIEPVA